MTTLEQGWRQAGMQASQSTLVIGVDEAGYGPNLGPLLIAASAWRVSELDCENFFGSADTTFQCRQWEPDCAHIPLGDSKRLYQPRKGLESLEAGWASLLELQSTRGQHAFSTQHSAKSGCTAVANVAQHGTSGIDSIEQLLRCTRSMPAEPPVDSAPWLKACSRLNVPAGLPPAEIKRLAQVAQAALDPCGTQFVGLRANVVAEVEFNRQIRQYGSKGQVLSLETMRLVNSLLQEHAESQPAVEVFCDRQGGRKNYFSILAETFPDRWFVESERSDSRSSYHSEQPFPCRIHFSVKGDRFPPTALASMFAKYLRERYMESFNAFWLQHCPGLKPTAGYPVDAARFRDAVAFKARQLSMPLDTWWRMK